MYKCFFCKTLMSQWVNTFFFQLLLFPEGTRFTPEKHEASLEVSRKKGYPELKHHLLPRTKGFAYSMQEMKGKGL